MSKSENHIEMGAMVVAAAGGGKYRIELDESKTQILACLSGKMKHNRVNVAVGDHVTVAVSPYDTSHGIIIYRG